MVVGTKDADELPFGMGAWVLPYDVWTRVHVFLDMKEFMKVNEDGSALTVTVAVGPWALIESLTQDEIWDVVLGELPTIVKKYGESQELAAAIRHAQAAYFLNKFPYQVWKTASLQEYEQAIQAAVLARLVLTDRLNKALVHTRLLGYWVTKWTASMNLRFPTQRRRSPTAPRGGGGGGI